MARLCTMEGCDRTHSARGLCASHYRRWQLYGDPGGPILEIVRDRKCSVAGCEQRHEAQGYCRHHYNALRRHGDPFFELPTSVERFWSRVHKTEDCWTWRGKITSMGYGSTTAFGKERLAHRVSYELVKGPIPEGLELDHLCRNTRCVNPDHLEPVTHAENVRRGQAGSNQFNKTHCVHGHEYTPENTGRNSVSGFRYCRTCANEQRRRKRLAGKGSI